MLKLPIPNDWDGETWTRFCVCWPDSPEWQELLLGFLTFVKRGRAWDENTGTIKAVQAIGEEIYKTNYPFTEVLLSCEEGGQLTAMVENLVRAVMLHAAVTGGLEITDLELPLAGREAVYFQTVDYRSTGLANRLGPNVPEDDENTIQATLAALKVSMDELKDAITASGSTGEDLEDDLAKVWGSIDDLTTILGGDVSSPPEPL